jgi:hypothetical protein
MLIANIIIYRLELQDKNFDFSRTKPISDNPKTIPLQWLDFEFKNGSKCLILKKNSDAVDF